jgi:hypothetical protein
MIEMDDEPPSTRRGRRDPYAGWCDRAAGAEVYWRSTDRQPPTRLYAVFLFPKPTKKALIYKRNINPNH